MAVPSYGDGAAWLFSRVTELLAAAALVVAVGLAATGGRRRLGPAGRGQCLHHERRANRGHRGWPPWWGMSGAVMGGLVVATADGGLGTGNGLGGGIVAMTVGLIGIALGGLALARSRRTD
jgi:hypothetical protein